MKTKALLVTMQKYAAMHHIPIIDAESVQWLSKFLVRQEIKKTLEIGGAIGYSTVCLQDATQGFVMSIEKDMSRYAQAQLFLQDYDERENIAFIHGDAKDPDFLRQAKKHAPYNLLFIDAAKRSNRYFFEQFSPLVADGGYIITDNLDFRGLIAADEHALAQLPRRLRSIVHAVAEYRQWLSENEQFKTEFVAVGDGLAVSQKR